LKRYLIACLSLMLCAAFAAAAGPTSGIETRYIDPSVRIEDDFFAHLNGKWLAEVPIPDDRPGWGTLLALHEQVQPQLRAIIERAPHKGDVQARKLGDLYASFMDEDRREALGYRPLARELAAIRALRNKDELAALMARLARIGVATPTRFLIAPDLRDSTRYAVNVAQGGLGLPDREYYLRADDARMAATKAAYQQLIATMFGMLGRSDGAAAARSVVALETELAQVQWTQVDSRDPARSYTRIALAELPRALPGYDWASALAAAGIEGRAQYVVVNQDSYQRALIEIIARLPLAHWQSYLEWQLLRSYTPYLSQAFVDARFGFYGAVLNGTAVNRPLWKRGVGAVETAMGEALGRQYVQRHFPPERKARVQAMVEKLLAAWRQSIAGADWMSPATRSEAQAKLALLRTRIGYPDAWRDDRPLLIRRDDLVGNMMRAHAFAYRRALARLGKPVGRDEWDMTPQTVNASYNALKNEVVFPAAILQSPFFDMAADDAVNYGAIGAVIGHEISHGFDDAGSAFDGAGNLRNWWSDADRANFQARAARLIAQYDAYSPLPGYTVGGALTVGENIGDNAGLAIAYRAWQLALGGKPAPVIDGLTGAQRFFMGYGQVWREKKRDAAALVQLKSGPHAPGKFRVNGALVNQDGFYEAFGIKPGDAMYLAPAQRVRIW
jgi:putative endopeptidase